MGFKGEDGDVGDTYEGEAGFSGEAGEAVLNKEGLSVGVEEGGYMTPAIVGAMVTGKLEGLEVGV